MKAKFLKKKHDSRNWDFKKKSKCHSIWDRFVDFWLSHRPEEPWSLTNKHNGALLPLRSACKWPDVGSCRCEMLCAISPWPSGDKELWGTARNNGEKAWEAKHCTPGSVIPVCPCFLSSRAWSYVRNEGWSWVLAWVTSAGLGLILFPLKSIGISPAPALGPGSVSAKKRETDKALSMAWSRRKY